MDQAAPINVSRVPSAEGSAVALGAPPPESSEGAPWPLVVGGATGIVAVDENGRVVRQITAMPAEAVRMDSDGSLWFLSPRDGALELRQLYPTGRQRVVTVVPRHFDLRQCAPSTSRDATELTLHETGDFVVSSTNVCVVLSDRNVNMRSLSVGTTISPGSGVHAPSVYAPDCGRVDAFPACHGSGGSVSRARLKTVHQYRYDEASGAVLRTADDAHAFTILGEEQTPGRVLATSPSGALMLIGLFQGQGDYFHWAPVAVDLRTGFAVRFANDGESTIAVPYAPGPRGEEQPESLDIVTETETFFVDEHRAVIDTLLVSFPATALTARALPRAVTLPGRPAPRR